MTLPFPKTVAPAKGTSRLYLDAHELRWELIRADAIIKEAYELLGSSGQVELQYLLVDKGITSHPDPIAKQNRLAAMHRITPKRDYLKLTLIALAVLSVLAWSCSQTENEILQGELAQYQIQR